MAVVVHLGGYRAVPVVGEVRRGEDGRNGILFLDLGLVAVPVIGTNDFAACVYDRLIATTYSSELCASARPSALTSS
jgi:hypothetical protein